MERLVGNYTLHSIQSLLLALMVQHVLCLVKLI